MGMCFSISPKADGLMRTTPCWRLDAGDCIWKGILSTIPTSSNGYVLMREPSISRERMSISEFGWMSMSPSCLWRCHRHMQDKQPSVMRVGDTKTALWRRQSANSVPISGYYLLTARHSQTKSTQKEVTWLLPIRIKQRRCSTSRSVVSVWMPSRTTSITPSAIWEWVERCMPTGSRT